jgi:hypothetical protein
MKTTILTFGLISGTLSSLMMLATVPFMDKIGFDKSEYLGYTAIVLSFLLVCSEFARTATTLATARSPSPKHLPSGSPLL